MCAASAVQSCECCAPYFAPTEMRSTTGIWSCAAGHGLPLGELVEDLVAGAAHEVGVHQLGDHPAPFQRVADRGADDGGFRDRRIEQAVVGESFRQAAVDGEGAAPVAVLLAEGDHGRVDGEAVHQRFEEPVADVERLHLRDGLALEQGRADLALDLLHARVLGEGLEQLRLAVVELLHLLVGEHDRRRSGRSRSRCAARLRDPPPA